MKKSIVITVLLVWNITYSQIVRSHIDTTQIQIGERITLTIEATVNPNEKVYFPKINDTFSKNLEIISQSIVHKNEKTKTIFRQTIIFTSFESGEHELKPLIIKIADGEYVTNSFIIKVNTLNLPDNAKINPIKDIYKDPETLWEKLTSPIILITFAMIIGFILLILLVVYLLKTKGKSKRNPITLSPDFVARKKLEDLYAKQYMHKGEVKRHYTELVTILKEYIGKRYAFSTEELLSSDILFFLKNKSCITTDDEKHLQILFNAGDLAKFAKSEPTTLQSEEHRDLALKFVNNTKPLFASSEIYVDRNSNAKLAKR